MADDLVQVKIELAVLAAQMGEAVRTGDRRHADTKDALDELRLRASENRHGLANANLKIDDLNVKLTGWPDQQGQGGIKGDVIAIRQVIEKLPAAMAATRSAGRWNALSGWGKLLVSTVIIWVIVGVLVAAVTISLRLTH